MTLATPLARQAWNTILDMNWDDPVNGRNTALYHTWGTVPEWWLDQPSAYFFYKVIPGIGPTLRVLNDNPADRIFVKRAKT